MFISVLFSWPLAGCFLHSKWPLAGEIALSSIGLLAFMVCDWRCVICSSGQASMAARMLVTAGLLSQTGPALSHLVWCMIKNLLAGLFGLWLAQHCGPRVMSNCGVVG